MIVQEVRKRGRSQVARVIGPGNANVLGHTSNPPSSQMHDRGPTFSAHPEGEKERAREASGQRPSDPVPERAPLLSRSARTGWFARCSIPNEFNVRRAKPRLRSVFVYFSLFYFIFTANLRGQKPPLNARFQLTLPPAWKKTNKTKRNAGRTQPRKAFIKLMLPRFGSFLLILVTFTRAGYGYASKASSTDGLPGGKQDDKTKGWYKLPPRQRTLNQSEIRITKTWVGTVTCRPSNEKKKEHGRARLVRHSFTVR